MNLIEITNKTGKVKLTDAVTPWSVEKLTEDIGKLFGAKALENGVDFTALINAGGESVDTLEIEINSPGGSIFDGYNIFNEINSLRDRGVVVTATVTGMAASMASVICMACNVVRMVPHGRMMIHEASNGVHGNAEAHRRAAELLDGISNDIATIYANRTKASVEKIRGLMKAETWMNAKESLKAGFIDSIYDPSTEKNTVDIAPTGGTPHGMSIFAKLFPGNDEALKIEASLLENDSLRADLTAAQARITELTALSEANTQLQGDLTTAQAKLTEFEAKSIEFSAKIIELEAAAKISETKIGEAAAQLLAAQGHSAPVDLSGEKAANTDAKTKTLAEFNNLSSIQRNEFIRNGGKLEN